MPAKQKQQNFMKLYNSLFTLRTVVLQQGLAIFDQWYPDIRRSMFVYSCRNLAFYLALRCHDLRKLQKALLPLGLSSLGRGEARAIANLDAAMASLGRICNLPEKDLVDYPSPKAFFYGNNLLLHNTNQIFGTHQPYRTHIMVTLPTEAATDYNLVKNLVDAGMDCARINCAHDNRLYWNRMISLVRKAERDTGKYCKIYMDIAGPKARITSILTTGAEVRLMKGSQLFLAQGDISKYPKLYKGSQVIACSIPDIFKHLKVGAPVLIDDGKIRAQVTSITKEGACLKITFARELGARLKNERSLNFPETTLDVPPLSAKDLKDLDFIATHADAIGYSFVKNAEDIRLLQKELKKRCGAKASQVALIAKIETKEAVVNLPEIIVQAASFQPFGVMIARGDLAVEVGYKRLSELQEEILWICEAAHIPVIWATQVLEKMVKTGVPSRAEITDAAMGERAECVMLNKGPYIVEAVAALAEILKAMGQHQYKKAPQLKALHIAMQTVEKTMQK